MINELDSLYKSRYPIVWIQTNEEVRALEVIKELAERRSASIYQWKVTTGLINGTVPIPNTAGLDLALAAVLALNDKDNRFVVMIDIHNFLTDNVVVRYLKDLCNKLPIKTRTTIFVISPSDMIPPELQSMITVVDMPLPDRTDLKAVIDRILEELEEKSKATLTNLKPAIEKCMDRLITAGLGLTEAEFTNIFTKMMVDKNINPSVILGEKKQVIRKSGMLEDITSSVNTADVGGLEAFKEWLTFAANTMDPAALEYGIDPLRGVLLVGPPGTGKTLLAKLVATKFGVPLFLLNMANVTTKFYGESTSNVKRTLKLADTMAPNVMLWDEVEKMFATGGAGEGHEETMRTLSVLLTHTEESKAAVFRVATCNNPMNLKPEMLQRFPKIFFVDLPSVLERREIFTIHLKDRKQDPKRFDLGKLAAATDGYVGREIRNIIKDAMTRTFYEKRPLETEDIIKVINLTTPLAHQDKIKAEIDEVRLWAGMNATSASIAPTPKKSDDFRDVIT